MTIIDWVVSLARPALFLDLLYLPTQYERKNSGLATRDYCRTGLARFIHYGVSICTDPARLHSVLFSSYSWLNWSLDICYQGRI